MIIQFKQFKDRNKIPWQTFHRVEGPGKVLLKLLEQFPFSAKKTKFIKFNNNFDLHIYLSIYYKRSILNYKKLIKQTKKYLLLKLKKSRFKILNKYFKMLMFLVNFLDNSFNVLINELFYYKIDENLNFQLDYKYFNLLKFLKINKYNKSIKIKKSDLKLVDNNDKIILQEKLINNNTYTYESAYENLDFYIFMNNGLFEFIGSYNDSILLKLKKKIFLYYYNSFGLESLLPKLSSGLKFLKEGETFFYKHNINAFNRLIQFINFFLSIHSYLGIGIKNKNFNSITKKIVKINSYDKLFFYNEIKNVYNLIYYYYFNFFFNFTTMLKFNSNTILTNFELYLLENNYNTCFFYYENNINFFYSFEINDNNSVVSNFKNKLIINLFDLTFFNKDFDELNKNKIFIKNYVSAENFYFVYNECLLSRTVFKFKNFKTAEWYKKFDSMVMFERFRFSNRLYMHDKLTKLKIVLTKFYKIYFYEYLYELMDTWDLLSHLPKKKKTEITRWLKKIQKFLSNNHHSLLKNIIKNFVWKDHKVLNKIIKSNFIWKGKKFIDARQASGSYYYAINNFFIETLNFLKLRLSTNDLIYDNFIILDELLVDFKFINKTDKLKDKRKKKSSKGAKHYYNFLNKQKESKGIFYCKYTRMSYNLNNSKSIKKYLFKLSKIVIPIKTYYRLYDLYVSNLNTYKNKKNEIDSLKLK